jgi:hypothetical protein
MQLTLKIRSLRPVVRGVFGEVLDSAFDRAVLHPASPHPHSLPADKHANFGEHSLTGLPVRWTRCDGIDELICRVAQNQLKGSSG